MTTPATPTHTPYPWDYDPITGEVFYDDSEGGNVHPLIATVSCENCVSHSQYLADIAMIASSPEMLDIIRFYAKWGIAGPKHDEEVMNDCGDKARAFILKLGVASP